MLRIGDNNYLKLSAELNLGRRITGLFLATQILSLLITLPVSSSHTQSSAMQTPLLTASKELRESQELKGDHVANLKQDMASNALSNTLVICTSKRSGARTLFQTGKCPTSLFDKTTWFAQKTAPAKPAGAKSFSVQICTSKTTKKVAVKTNCDLKKELSATYVRWLGTPAKPPAPRVLPERLGSVQLEIIPPISDGGAKIIHYNVLASPGDLRLTVSPTRKFTTLSGMVPGTLYLISVEAVNNQGASVKSEVQFLSPNLPSAPVIKEISSTGSNKARIFFEPSSFDGGAAITRYSASAIARGNEIIALNSSVISPGVLEVYGLPNATTLAFFISAHNAVGASLHSDISILTTGALRVINVPTIGGLIAPVTGALPITSVNGGNGYSGTVSWSGSPTTFSASTVYIATINLTPSTGFTLSGVLANFFTVSGASLVTNSANSGVVTAVFPATALGAGLVPTFATPTPTSSGFTVQITNYDATYIWVGTANASGAVSISGSGLVTVIGVAANTSSALTITTIRSGLANGAATVSATSTIGSPVFTLSSSSEVRAVNTAATGFTLNSTGGAIASFAISPAAPSGMNFSTSTGAFSGTPSAVASAITYTITATNAAGSASQTFSFTVSTANTIINIVVIAGVTAPVTGATPVTTIIETAQYTGTITWHGSGAPVTFAAGVVYTATITLTAKSGFTLTGVATDFFTVAGSTSDTNTASSGVVTAVFPATASTYSISSVTAAPTSGSETFGYVAAVSTTLTLTRAGDSGSVPTTILTVTGGSWTVTSGSGVTTSSASLSSGSPVTLTLNAASGTISLALATGANAGSYTATTNNTPTSLSYVVTVAQANQATLTAAQVTSTAAYTGSAYTATPSFSSTGGSGGGAVTYSVTNGTAANCSLTNSSASATLTATSSGTCLIQATKAADTNYNSATSANITFTFTKKVISIAAILGVAIPVKNASASNANSITATVEYTGTYTWSPLIGGSNKFAGTTVYTATITLTATADYTLTGVGANFFTVASSSPAATNLANSGVITAAFAATG